MKPRLLGDENISHKLVAACRRLHPEFPLVHLAAHNKDWCGLNDDDLLDACLAAGAEPHQGAGTSKPSV